MIGTISVTGEPVQILSVPPSGEYQFIALSNNGNATVFLKFTPDSDAVTPTNGVALPPGSSLLIDQDASPILQNGIFGVCASGQSSTVAVQAY